MRIAPYAITVHFIRHFETRQQAPIAPRGLSPYNPEMPNNHHPEKQQPPTADSTIQCLNDLEAQKTSKGHRLAEWTVQMVGSWKFIIIQSALLVVWTIVNIVAWFEHWDPYPFILLNLFLALQAAYTGPVIMMTQNRQAARDRLEAHNDYLINIKAEQEIRTLLKHLNAQSQAIEELKGMVKSLQKNDLR